MLKEALILSEPQTASGSYDSRSNIFFTIALMIEREWRRLLMEPSRVLGVLLQPLLFLLVFGTGFSETFKLEHSKVSYFAFFFPGILGLVVLFSSIYATLTLVEDKKCGFFRLVLIGPSGVIGAILGKIVATASLGFIQGLIFSPLLFLMPFEKNSVSFLFLTIFLLAGSFCFALIGVLFAWICDTSSAFHALMSIVLIPMWLLSGAMFPVFDNILFSLSLINPMSYLVAGLRMALESKFAYFELVVLFIFSIIIYALLVVMLKKRPLE